ncbi:MAG: D-xylose 1-dehydrogenase Gfo6 [Halobacteriaceae archaeon]
MSDPLGRYLDGFTDRDWADGVDEPVRFALVGLGWWTQDHVLPALAASDACEATALVTGTPEKADRLAAETPTVEATMTYEEYHDGAGAEAYDAVYVCTPNATHLDLVETAADLGNDVLCEKPMEASVDRAEALVAACRDAGVTLMIAYRMHTEPAVRRAREFVRAGGVGDPLQVHGHMSDDILGFIDDPDQWRLDPDLSGGTTVNDVGIYPLNTARFVLDADPVAVYGTTRAETEPFDGLDEHGAFQVEFPGTTAVCTASHNAHQASHLTVLGTEGRVTVEPAFFPQQDRGLTVERGDARATFDFEQIDQMQEEFDYFAARVANDEPVDADGEHGLVDMRAIEAIYESVETGQRVEL